MRKISDNIMWIIGVIVIVVGIVFSILATIGSLIGMVNTIIHDIVFFACLTAIIVFFFLFDRVRKLTKEKKLRDYVRWCVTQDLWHGEFSLLNCVEIVESKSDLYKNYFQIISFIPQIPYEYWITHEEKEIASEILEIYQKELMKLYFEGRLYYEKKTTREEFF